MKVYIRHQTKINRSLDILFPTVFDGSVGSRLMRYYTSESKVTNVIEVNDLEELYEVIQMLEPHYELLIMTANSKCLEIIIDDLYKEFDD